MTKMSRLAKRVNDLYDSGFSIDEIVEKTEQHPIYVRAHLKAFNPGYSPFVPRKLTKRIRSRIAELALRGHSISEIAREVGMPASTVRSVVYETDPNFGQPTEVPAQVRRSILKLADARVPTSKICARLKLSYATVRNVIRQDSRPVPPLTRRKWTLTDEQKTTILELTDAGDMARSIAVALGVPYPLVLRCIHEGRPDRPRRRGVPRLEIPAEAKSRILELVDSGATVSAAAKETGAPLSSVQKFVREERPGRKPASRISPRTVAVIEALKAGQSPAEIARRLGVSRQRVYQIRMRANPPGRKPYSPRTARGKAIHALLKAGVKPIEVAERVGCNPSQVYIIKAAMERSK